MPAIRHADLFALLSRLLPNEELLYHSPLPRWRPYDPFTTRFIADKVILSLTPTSGVYEQLHQSAQDKKRCAVFLHRPFQLDRQRVPHGTVVFASHKRFDELYTTGYNHALADEQGVSQNANDRRCLKGYKNDPERKIGLLGRLLHPRDAREYAQELSMAFEGYDLLDLAIDRPSPENDASPQSVETKPTLPSGNITALFCLNAFTPEVLARAITEVQAMDLRNDEILCLTGAVRELGVAEARRLGLNILAVGHKRCEDWGMRYFERQCKSAFPWLEIVLIDEPEEKADPRPKQIHNGDSRHPEQQTSALK